MELIFVFSVDDLRTMWGFRNAGNFEFLLERAQCDFIRGKNEREIRQSRGVGWCRAELNPFGWLTPKVLGLQRWDSLDLSPLLLIITRLGASEPNYVF